MFGWERQPLIEEAEQTTSAMLQVPRGDGEEQPEDKGSELRAEFKGETMSDYGSSPVGGQMGQGREWGSS